MDFKVIGIGDNVVDKYMNLGLMFPGGQCVNFAVYAKMLGFDSAYMGVFGTDAAAAHVKRILALFHVDIRRAVTRSGENGFARINLKDDGDRVFIVSNKGGIAAADPLVLTPADLDYIKRFGLIFTDDNARMDMDRELPKMKSTGVPVIYDFSTRHSDEALARFCPHVTYAILSCGNLSVDETMVQIEKARKAGAPGVIATRGMDGSYFTDDGEMHFQEAYPVDALDTLGAGDSYCTAFLLNYVPWLNRNGAAAAPAEKTRVIRRAMQAGALFAAKSCLVNGAFGFGVPVVE